ncbi:hepatoma up regulated protein [Echinococcus multilocularis]|uniref:Hepatoma up regulated protein n=1 Tax=Echinococcus multilocularis TaxID=6211 RepID=A0A087W251_ECHMU|nr:hepatoma up regulated protein [Echinococcus multilocularis]
MNITLGGSTYTKTIDLESQDFYDMPHFGTFESETNGPNSSPIIESSIQNSGQVIQCSANCNEPKISPNLASNHPAELANFPITKTPEKTNSTPRSTFFSRLARRLTIRRTVPKLGSFSPPHGSANSLEGVIEKSSPQISTGRKIRRWLSKHLMPPPKNSLHKASPSNFSTRAATLDGAVDKCVSQSADDFGSAPTQRRALPPPNTSTSSLCNSPTGTISLADEPFEASGNGIRQETFSYGSGRLNSTGAVVSVSTKQDNPTTQISSAFSSPSVTGIGPPPRYLNVSLAAFGYTGCNCKWVSAQTLERGKTAATAQASSSSAVLATDVTPQRHKSTSPTSSSHSFAQRPYRLDFRDGQNPEASSTIQASGASPAAVTERPNNSSGIAIRVRRNCLNAISITTGGEGDQSQDLNRSRHSHNEHWNRSSLIMLAVAQASPRSHNAPPSVAGSTVNMAGRQSISHGDTTGGSPASPSKPFSGHRLVYGEENSSLDVSLPKVEEVPSMNTTDTSQDEAIALTTGLEEAASSLALVNGHTLDKNKGGMAVAVLPMKGEQSDEVKDGHYFLRVVEDTAQELRDRVEEIERDLNENEFNDEVSGHLRTTVGKVNLLLSQKFVQFRGLCMDSIEATQAADSAGDFVTLPSDLEGFWAMVMLQVDDVRSMIAKCNHMRRNDWRIAPDPSIHNGQNSCLQTPSKPKRCQLKTAASPATVKSRQNKEAADLARYQARERLKAAKRQYMRVRQDECNASFNDSRSSKNALDGENSTFLVL